MSITIKRKYGFIEIVENGDIDHFEYGSLTCYNHGSNLKIVHKGDRDFFSFMNYSDITYPKSDSIDDLVNKLNSDIFPIESNYGVRKFGLNPDIDTSVTGDYIWENEGVYTWPDLSGATMYISSTDASDSSVIQVRGTSGSASNYEYQKEQVTLNGQNKTEIGSSITWSSLTRAWAEASISGTVYIYEDATLSGGKPTDDSKIRALISANKGQTLMAMYMVPGGRRAVVYSISASINISGGSVDRNAEIELYTQKPNMSERIRAKESLGNNGNTSDEWVFGQKILLEEGEKIYIKCSGTTSNNTEITAGFDMKFYDT